MSAILAHAQAARIIGEVMIERAATIPDFGAGLILDQLGQAYQAAAERMIEQSRADAQAFAASAACTLDHRTMKGPKCPSCGAPRQ